jgi:adenosylcobyric acid synthase
LRAAGWDRALARHLRYGGKAIGICGGFQMLGRRLDDPYGVEGAAGAAAGLGLLDIETTITPEKRLARAAGRLAFAAAAVAGYEIHMGVTTGAALDRPALLLDGRADGAVSADGQILGTCLHGLFDHPEARDALLRWAGLEPEPAPDYRLAREAHIDRLADAVSGHLDLERIAPHFRPRVKAAAP